MSLNWSVGDIENYREVCYEQMTTEEAEANGTTIEKLLNQSSFAGPNWYTPGSSDTERLANAGVAERLRPITNMFIWATMSVDLTGITEENHVEFWVRMKLLESLTGSFMRQWNEETEKWDDRPITIEEVKAHIGLHTNVSKKTWREFMMRHLDHWRSEAMRKADFVDSRMVGQDAPLSQVAKDTHVQLEVWKRALSDYYMAEEDAETESEHHDQDLEWAYNAINHMDCSATAWEEFENDREQRELEGEEE